MRAPRFDQVYRDAQNIVIEQHRNDLRGLTDESTEMAREAARAIEAARAALTDLRRYGRASSPAAAGVRPDTQTPSASPSLIRARLVRDFSIQLPMKPRYNRA